MSTIRRRLYVKLYLRSCPHTVLYSYTAPVSTAWSLGCPGLRALSQAPNITSGAKFPWPDSGSVVHGGFCMGLKAEMNRFLDGGNR